MIVAAVLAALVNLSLLQSRDETFLVTVAASEILPGQTIAVGDLRSAEIRASGDLLDRLVMFEDVAGLEGLIAVRPLASGDLVGLDDFQAAAAPLQQRAMSIPVDEEFAVGGAVTSADLVDVIAVEDGVASYVVAGAQVLAVPVADERGFTGSGPFFVTVAVTGDQALAIASALDVGAVHVVRSTGAEEPDLTRYDPTEIATEEEAPAGAADEGGSGAGGGQSDGGS